MFKMLPAQRTPPPFCEGRTYIEVDANKPWGHICPQCGQPTLWTTLEDQNALFCNGDCKYDPDIPKPFNEMDAVEVARITRRPTEASIQEWANEVAMAAGSLDPGSHAYAKLMKVVSDIRTYK